MTIIVYAACFLALAAVSGLAAASGRRWALRLPLLAATPLLALAVWWQMSQRDGWPTAGHPADGAAFVAGVVEAPRPGNSGAIYIWAQPPSSTTPRAYRLPYTQQLERQVARAAKAAKRGARVGVRAHTKSKNRGRDNVRAKSLEFYRLAPPTLPLKDHTG
jgi:hypothetical protein